jgi:hypothetical protein
VAAITLEERKIGNEIGRNEALYHYRHDSFIIKKLSCKHLHGVRKKDYRRNSSTFVSTPTSKVILFYLFILGSEGTRQSVSQSVGMSNNI